VLPAGWAMTRGSGKVLNTNQPDRTLINHESTGKTGGLEPLWVPNQTADV